MRLQGRKVVLTGAAGGIGSAVARRFLAEGAFLCLVDDRGAELKQLAQELDASDRVLTTELDVSDEAGCNKLAAIVDEAWKGVDVLINDAGQFPVKAFEDLSYDEWRQVVAVNLDGPFLMTKALLPLLKESGKGRTINVSSGSIFRGAPEQCHYVAAKAGVIGLTRSLAQALGQCNITVNAITPGMTVTPPVAKLFSAAVIDEKAQVRAIKRREVAEDLVGAFLFLASDDASFITGQTLNVDGGASFV